MHRTIVIAALLPSAPAWAVCNGLNGQDQLDCVNDKLNQAIQAIQALQTDNDGLVVALEDAESRLAVIEGTTPPAPTSAGSPPPPTSPTPPPLTSTATPW